MPTYWRKLLVSSLATGPGALCSFEPLLQVLGLPFGLPQLNSFLLAEATYEVLLEQNVILCKGQL